MKLATMALCLTIPACTCSKGGSARPPPRSTPNLVAKEAEAPNIVSPAVLARFVEHPTRGPEKPLPVLWLQPGDLTSSCGDTSIRAWLDNGGVPVSPALLDEVASVLELREQGTLAVVAVDVVKFNPPIAVAPTDNAPKGTIVSGTPPGTDQRAYVELRPKAPLSGGWYVLSISKVPTGARLAPWSAQPPPAGVYAARFSPSPNPVLSRVLICRKSVGVYRAVFEFSENVQAGPQGVGAYAKVEQLGTGGACTYTASGPLPNGSMRWIDQGCTGFSDTDPFIITLSPGLSSSAGGRAVKTAAGALTVSHTVVLSTLPELETGCRVWRP